MTERLKEIGFYVLSAVVGIAGLLLIWKFNNGFIVVGVTMVMVAMGMLVFSLFGGGSNRWQ